MKIGDVVRIGFKREVALVIGIAPREREIHVRFLRDLHTCWVLVNSAEVLSEGR